MELDHGEGSTGIIGGDFERLSSMNNFTKSNIPDPIAGLMIARKT